MQQFLSSLHEYFRSSFDKDMDSLDQLVIYTLEGDDVPAVVLLVR